MLDNNFYVVSGHIWSLNVGLTRGVHIAQHSSIDSLCRKTQQHAETGGCDTSTTDVTTGCQTCQFQFELYSLKPVEIYQQNCNDHSHHDARNASGVGRRWLSLLITTYRSIQKSVE